MEEPVEHGYPYTSDTKTELKNTLYGLEGSQLLHFDHFHTRFQSWLSVLLEDDKHEAAADNEFHEVSNHSID